MHARAFAADDDADGLREIEVPGVKLASWVKRDAPDSGALDLGDRRRQAGDARDRQQLGGAGAGFDRDGRERSAAVLGNDGAAGAGDLRAAQDGAQVPPWFTPGAIASSFSGTTTSTGASFASSSRRGSWPRPAAW
ncbi:MAG: hypothetical protein AUI15_36755 [Actinobacteria bacterium 13_2_20CM_2_66_6]|nr:MAG: hypothetical protein AUI15_36755 [Actinobacteria bacterium 13_2_20CM_2_66_6]